MQTFIALLRGINVGGHRVIAMADLRDRFAAAGSVDVVTHIQSGNVVFRHASDSRARLATELEGQIAKATGFDVAIVLRSAAEWDAVVADNPFADADADHLHVSFFATPPMSGALDSIDAVAHRPERFALARSELYLYLPGGLGRSKLVAALGKLKPIAAATTRNWRTVLKLRELAS